MLLHVVQARAPVALLAIAREHDRPPWVTAPKLAMLPDPRRRRAGHGAAHEHGRPPELAGSPGREIGGCQQTTEIDSGPNSEPLEQVN